MAPLHSCPITLPPQTFPPESPARVSARRTSCLWLHLGALPNHDRIRSLPNGNETKASKTLIRNGKYYVPARDEGSDFKELFRRSASAGAGRPVDTNGFPHGAWTPDLLAEAISHIDVNRSGIDLRTVQLWFQDNDKGISSDNIRWLARIFGCDDPKATSEWQALLSAARSRLTVKRREKRRKDVVDAHETADVAGFPIVDDKKNISPQMAGSQNVEPTRTRPSLAQRSEMVFGRGSPLDLPAAVFAGAVALGFLSYFFNVHSVTYARANGVIKQVGLLWAPNWTFLFMVFMPLFFSFATDILVFWKNEGRSRVHIARAGAAHEAGWIHKVEESSYTYWAVLLICLGFAGVFQWISVCVIPLMEGGSDYAIDWASLTIVRPDVVSIPQEVTLTGLAYLYMCLCFYLFFVGLILLYTVTHDFHEISRKPKKRIDVRPFADIREVAHPILRAIFRCSICGLLIAVTMKLQSAYLTTSAESIWGWLADDLSSILLGADKENSRNAYSSPTHYSSLIVAMATGAVYLYAFVRLGLPTGFNATLGKMGATVIYLFAGYLLIGTFEGFSILLATAVIFAVYGLFDPGFGERNTNNPGDDRSVL